MNTRPRTLAIAAAVVITAVLAAIAFTAILVNSLALADTPRPCDWGREYTAALKARGENPTNWTVITARGDGPGPAWTILREQQVTVTRELPCRHVASAVNHEWMHLQQARMYGATAAERFYRAAPGWMERVADCGSALLGSSWVPYLRESPCSVQAIRAAEYLIAYHR